MRSTVLSAGAIACALAGAVLISGTAGARPGDALTVADLATSCAVPATHDPDVIQTVYRVGDGLDVSAKVMLAGFEAGWVESHMNNLNCGDLDSLGVFQQRPSQGWGTAEQIMNVAYAANSFFTRAIDSERANPGYTAGQLAQSVQRSAFPSRYDEAESKARALIAEAEAAVGHSVDGSDISGDGYADLLGVKSDGTLWYYANTNPTGLPFNSGSQIGYGFQNFNWVDGADVSGDGAADMLARKPDGTLWYYPNNKGSNPGGVPFVDGRQIGYGFQAFDALDAADINGDGDADLIGRKPDGTLWYYVNSGTANGAMPFNSGSQIGYGFQVFDRIDGADVSGDGHADLLARKADGTLWYYPNNSGSNPGGAPFVNGRQIGHGFQVFNALNAADVSGDGAADLLARKPDGTLWYYLNSGTADGAMPYDSGRQIGHGFQVFTTIA